MAYEIPDISIFRDMEDGRGRVAYTFSPRMWTKVLSVAGIESPQGISEDWMRTMCRNASNAETTRRIEEAEAKRPGRFAYVSSEGLELRTSDIGLDMLQRFIDSPEDELPWDPQYSTVNFELRVFDEAASQEAGQLMGQQMLRVTLEPPNLV